MSIHHSLFALLFLAGTLCVVAGPAVVHVALIFDDGPHATQTDKLLEIFAAEQIHVTFGTIGRNAATRPDLLRRVAAAGHEIANHSYSHKPPKDLPAEGVAAEVAGAQETITAITGTAPRWYWPPYLAIDDQVRASVAKVGIQIYLPQQLVVSGDYMTELDAAEIFRRATTGVADGSVILFHEWRPETAGQIPAVIAELRRQGCVFLTFSEMAAYLGRRP